MLVVAALASASVALATPAQAESIVVKDARGDMGHKADVLRVRVANEQRVRVKVTHDNLTRRGNKAATIFVDTDRSRRGPEFGFVAGIFEGSDYQLVRMRNWKPRSRPLSCPISLKLDYSADTSYFTMRRSCLDRPGRVRVAVKVSAERAMSGEFAHDWLTGRRQFTRLVARG
jgi:hypothetical protein